MHTEILIQLAGVSSIECIWDYCSEQLL